MAGPYVIPTAVSQQPVPTTFGKSVKDAINDLDARVGVVESTQQVVIKRGRRTTATGNITTTETGWLRLDNVPVRSGQIYQINTTNINVDTSVDNDVGDVKLRVAFSASPGTNATTSSTQIARMRNTIDNLTQSNVIPMNAFYVAPGDGYISLLLTLVRQAGTGNLVLFASSTEIIDLVVQFGGPDPGDTGVVL